MTIREVLGVQLYSSARHGLLIRGRRDQPHLLDLPHEPLYLLDDPLSNSGRCGRTVMRSANREREDRTVVDTVNTCLVGR